LKVLLIDKQKFPRFKECGGGLPTHVLKRFSYINDLDIVESYSYGGILNPPSLKYNLKIEKEEPIIAMVRREKFDYELVKLAIENGSQFIDGKTVTDLKIKKDNAEVIINNQEKIETQIIIGADGCLSTVARKAGLIGNQRKIGICAVEEFPLSSKIIDEYFTNKRLCQLHSKFHNMIGYGWVFPKDKHVNIGIADYRLTLGDNTTKINIIIRNFLDIEPIAFYNLRIISNI